MKRRDFLVATAAVPALHGFPRLALAEPLPFAPRAGDAWRTFEITTRVEILKPSGVTRAWVPVPAMDEPWQRALGSEWSGNAASVRLIHDGKHGAAMVAAEWPAGSPAPTLVVTSRAATRDRAVSWGKPISGERLDRAAVQFYTEPTELKPLDGIVRKTAVAATRGARGDVEKARALYEWVVDNTFRDPKTRGCGVGDVKAMLETGNLGGKCADLNALYVALARSVGLPARDVYGLRVAKSAFGYRSLGAGSANVTRAQHCRAEVFLSGYGWVPVDPADVRKVVLEERPQPTTLDDPLVKAVRPKLFGAWEMNWLAYNSACDIALPGSGGSRVAFLMYPQAETAAGRVDSLDPDNFRYTITAREIAPA